MTGVVKSTKMNRTIVMRMDYLHFIKKYQRYEKRHTNISAHISPCFRCNEGDKVVVEDDVEALSYDHVIVATEANQAVKFVRSDPEAVALLKNLRYERTETVIHTDTLLAPPEFSAWAPVNYLFDEKGQRSMATIWWELEL